MNQAWARRFAPPPPSEPPPIKLFPNEMTIFTLISFASHRDRKIYIYREPRFSAQRRRASAAQLHGDVKISLAKRRGAGYRTPSPNIRVSYYSVHPMRTQHTHTFSLNTFMSVLVITIEVVQRVLSLAHDPVELFRINHPVLVPVRLLDHLLHAAQSKHVRGRRVSGRQRGHALRQLTHSDNGYKST